MDLIRVSGVKEAIEKLAPFMVGHRMEIKRLFQDQDYFWKHIHRPGFQLRGTRSGLFRDFNEPHGPNKYYFYGAHVDSPKGTGRRFVPDCDALSRVDGVDSFRGAFFFKDGSVPSCLEKCRNSLHGRLSRIPIHLDDGTIVTIVSMQGCRSGLGCWDRASGRYVPVKPEAGSETGVHNLIFPDFGYVSVGMFAPNVCSERLDSDIFDGARSTHEAWDFFHLDPTPLVRMSFDRFETSRSMAETKLALEFVFEIDPNLLTKPGIHGVGKFPVNKIGNPVLSPPSIFLNFHESDEPILFIEVQKEAEKTRILVDTGFEPLLYPGLMK